MLNTAEILKCLSKAKDENCLIQIDEGHTSNCFRFRYNEQDLLIKFGNKPVIENTMDQICFSESPYIKDPVERHNFEQLRFFDFYDRGCRVAKPVEHSFDGVTITEYFSGIAIGRKIIGNDSHKYSLLWIDSLADLHSHDVYHGDPNPSNLLVNERFEIAWVDLASRLDIKQGQIRDLRIVLSKLNIYHSAEGIQNYFDRYPHQLIKESLYDQLNHATEKSQLTVYDRLGYGNPLNLLDSISWRA